MATYIVLDASVARAWSFSEPFTSQAQAVLAAIEDRRVIALAPDRFADEVLRICQKKALPPPVGASIAPDDAWLRFLEIVTSPIVLLPSEEVHERAWQLAFAAGLTTHDALYLALAERWGAELWTLDDLLAGPAAAAYAASRNLRLTPFPY
jgi:predicted nucleic acid-binding protein